MPAFVISLWRQIVLSSPLFVLLALGYGLVRFGQWPSTITDGLTRFVFSLALPAMLFRMMCDFSERPAVDARLLIAFLAAVWWSLLSGESSPAGYFIWMVYPARYLPSGGFFPIT